MGAVGPLGRLMGVAVVVALLWALAGCSSSADDMSAVEESAVGGMDGGAAYSEAEDVGTEDTGGEASGAEPAADRALIVTGAMYMTVEDPIVAADRAAGIVQRAGGRVDARSETAATEYDGGSAWLTLRIPASELDGAVEDLRELGTVDEYSTESADVTREVTDLEAQISTLEASTARIEGLLAEAEKIADIITLENELDGRQAELEALTARQRGLDDQVSMSTIDLSLTTEPIVAVETSDDPDSFWDGLTTGWDGLVAFLSGVLVVVGVLLPWAAVAGVVAVLVWLAVRALRRNRAPEAAPAPAQPATASADGD